MAEQTNIEWADSTFNPWIGCTRVSPGCDHCYAAVSTPARTQGVEWGAKAPRHRTSKATWAKPVLWNREHEAFELMHGRRRRVFCASLADVFDRDAPDGWRADLWTLIEATPNLDWLLLTKRVSNVASMVPEGWITEGFPLQVWLGITAVNQDEAVRDLPRLQRLPARVKFLSYEPAVGELDLLHTVMTAEGSRQLIEFIDWVIAGGESGPRARMPDPRWFRDVRDQCGRVEKPFLFKQWGEWINAGQVGCPHGPPFSRWVWIDGKPYVPGNGHRGMPLMCRAGKKAAGRMLDGVEHIEFPA